MPNGPARHFFLLSPTGNRAAAVCNLHQYSLRFKPGFLGDKWIRITEEEFLVWEVMSA